MPGATRSVSWSQLRVGLVALAALVVLAVLIFLLTGSKGVFETNVMLRTYMEDASGMAQGAPVRLNGYGIGNVDRIQLSGSKDPNRTVEFVMSVRERYLKDIPDDSTAAINAASLLGDKFINITKGPNAHGRHVNKGDEIRSVQTQDIPELMAQSAKMLASFQNILLRLDGLVAGIEAGKGNIGKLIKDEELYERLNGIANEGQRLLADVRAGGGTISKLIYDDKLYQDLRAPLQRIDAILADLQKGQGTAGKLVRDPVLYDEAQNTIAQIRKLIEGINAGRGTAGKLLRDEQLYQQLTQLATKLDATIDKVTSGQGTLGQFLVNPQLYETLNSATREMQVLVRDMHANPKKFLSIKLGLF